MLSVCSVLPAASCGMVLAMCASASQLAGITVACIFTLQKPSLIQAFNILRKRCNPDISDSHSSFFILSSLDHTYAALFTELCETKVNCIKPMTLSQTSSAFWVCINLQQSHVIQCAMAVDILFTLVVQHNVRGQACRTA